MPIANWTHFLKKEEEERKKRKRKKLKWRSSLVQQVVKLGQMRAQIPTAGAKTGVGLVNREACMKILGCGVHGAKRKEAQQDTPVP